MAKITITQKNETNHKTSFKINKRYNYLKLLRISICFNILTLTYIFLTTIK